MRRAVVIGLGALTTAAVVVVVLALQGGGTDDVPGNASEPRRPPPVPTWERPAILRVDETSGALSSAWPPGVFRPTNVFVRTTGHVDQMVYAGASGRTPSDGMIATWEQNGKSGLDVRKLSTARGTGALRLTSFAGRTVRFTSASGRTGSYDLDRNRLRLDGKPGVRIDCVTTPCPSP